MAISNQVTVEIRPTNGDDTFGGGWVQGTTGTDLSTANTAAYSVTDGVTAGTTTIVSATANFGTNVVGNLIYVTGGTGSITAARYQIISRTNATTIVVDRATGLSVGTGATLKIGGAMKTISAAMAEILANGAGGTRFFVKAEATIAPTAGYTLNVTGVAVNTTALPNRITGYTNTRGDDGRVTVQATTNTGITLFTVSTTSWIVENFVLDGNLLGTSKGIVGSSSYLKIRNCKFTNFTGNAIQGTSATYTVVDCEVTGCTAAATVAVNFGSVSRASVIRCWVHDNACIGIQVQLGGLVWGCLATNNTGAGNDGIQLQDNYAIALNNTCYGNARYGILLATLGTSICTVRNNLLVNNGSYGIANTNAGAPANSGVDGNAFYNNTTGTRFQMDDTGTTIAQNAAAPYTNVNDITLTGDPFTSAATGDFTLNPATAQALYGTGTPGALPGITQVGYAPFGALAPRTAARAQIIGGGT